MARYVVVSNVKKLAKENGRRVGKDFIGMLDRKIEQVIRKACDQHNGGKVTLDSSLAEYVGIS